jgi:hypothetical protein
MIARADHEDDDTGSSFEENYDIVSGGKVQQTTTKL